MQLVTPLFSSIFAGGAATTAPLSLSAAAGGTLAAGTATSWLGGVAGSSVLTAVQGAGTAFSALASIGAGIAKSQDLRAEAHMEQLRARDEFIAGEEQAAKLKTELAATIAKQAVAFAAGGVDLGAYSVDRAKAQAIDDAERELATSRGNSLTAGLVRRSEARSRLAQAGWAATGGFIGALGGRTKATDFLSDDVEAIFARG